MISREQRAARAKAVGAFSEARAAEYLLANGYTIHKTNWKPTNSHLEVDIIAEKRQTLIFIEVKARTSSFTDPADAVDAKKISKLIRAAEIYMESFEHDFDFRFDIITVTPKNLPKLYAEMMIGYDPDDDIGYRNEENVGSSLSAGFASRFAPKCTEPTLDNDEYALDHIIDAFMPPLKTLK